MDLIEKILDDNNSDDVYLTNELTGEELPFEQIAKIPYKDVTYAILSPKQDTDEIRQGEGVVFKIIEDEGDLVLVMEEDENIIDKIFDIYADMYREEFGENPFEVLDEESDENKAND